MPILRKFKRKNNGKDETVDLGALAKNVTQDATHRFVSDTEKQTWNGKADPGDIPTGPAANYSVANNCTTTEAGSVLDARQGKVLMDKANQLSSDLGGLTFGKTTEGEWGYKPEGADAVIPFKKDPFKYLRMYYTDIAVNSSYTAHQSFLTIPKSVLKSISFTAVNLSDAANNDATGIQPTLLCAFVGSVTDYDILLQNGIVFSYVGAGSANHKVKTVIFRNGTYTFDDFSDFYDIVVFGLASHYYVRGFLDGIAIELR